MSIISKNKIQSISAWEAADFKNNNTWKKVLNNEQVKELLEALGNVKNLNKKIPDFSKKEFILNTLGVNLNSWSKELENGSGFMLLKNIPIHGLNEEDTNILYYGLGLYLGEPVRQNPSGDLIGKVMNIGDLSDRQTRVYETNAYLPYHSDPSDLVGLLCIRKAKSGGISSLISSHAIYNEILDNYKEYLSILYKPMYYPHLGGSEPALSPIYSFYENKMTCRYMRQYIELGHDMMNSPLSNIEIEALDLMDFIMEKKNLRLDMMLEPGDLQLVNNYNVLHSRTSFEDYEKLSYRRKKLRLWLKSRYARNLGYLFQGRNGFPK